MSGKSGGEPIKVLTIAGSDSGGAAGLQADLKSFSALGAYGMSVVTVVTAQNSQEVRAVFSLPADLVESQLQAVFEDYGADAVKTGFIGRAELVVCIARQLARQLASSRPPFLVVDPVLVNHHGQSMFPADVTQAYREALIPLASVVTPNPEEAALLSGRAVESLDDLVGAARAISVLGVPFVLAKGYRDGDEMVDVLVGSDGSRFFRRPVIDTQNTHGSGDTLSAALCVYLAQGRSMGAAVEEALQFTERAIRRAAGWRMGRGHGPVGQLRILKHPADK
jgi:hydroxymethylpyrimidine/phosphomethylpyrimidine kinase